MRSPFLRHLVLVVGTLVLVAPITPGGAAAFDEDGVSHGPVWRDPCWIGLRQMGHTVRCRYDDLRIHPLR